MASYKQFAFVYDELTENVEYKKRFNYLMSFFKEFNILPGESVLDLACGTGSFTKLLIDSGYNTIGVDSSEEMLTVADLKCEGRAKLLKGDMRDFDFSSEFSACICCLDSINHLSNIAEVKAAFNCVSKSLKKHGLFIFDVNTVYKHNKILSDHTFVFDKEDYFLAWDNEYISNGEVGIYLDLFVKEGERYKRFSDYFTEKAYPVSSLKAALKPYFDLIGVYDDLTFNPPKKASERLYFVCRSK